MGMRQLIWRGQQLLKHCFAHNFLALLCFIYLSNPIDVYAGGVKTDHRFNSVTTRTHAITWCDIYIYEYCILYVCAGWGGHMRKRASLFGWSDKAQSQHCLFALEESIAPGRKSKIPGSLHKKLKEKNKQRLMASLGNGSGAQGAAVTACWERLPRNWRSNCNDEEKKNWTPKGSKLR